MRFNGAAAFRPRKAVGLVRKALERQELQWGRGLSAAEGAERKRKAAAAAALQWGRGLSAAEGVRPQEAHGHGRDASMGPRPFGRGR